MRRDHCFLSTIDEKAPDLAAQYGIGLELTEFGVAENMDLHFEETDLLIREKLRKAPAGVLHGPYSELFPCAIDSRARALARERYLQAMEMCRRYGIRKLVLHGGFNPWLYFPCWYEEQSVLFWKEFSREIPDDLVICLENVLEEHPEPLASILRQTDCPNLRMCLDIGHAHAYSKDPVDRWITHCADLIDHFHIHNNDSSWDTHSPLTEGTIPMEETLALALELCPGATFTLELADAASSLAWLTATEILEGSN